MLKKFFGSPEYKFTKKQLANFTNELKALGSRKLTNGDLMRFRERYKRILNATNKSNISEKESAKLHKKLEEFKARFKHLGFIDDMDLFMPPSIPDMSSRDSIDLQERQEEERYNLRSRRKKGDDERHSEREEEGYRSGEFKHSHEYCIIKARLNSLISTLEDGLNSNLVEHEDNQFTVKQIGDEINRGSFSDLELEQLLELYSRCVSLLQRSENRRKQDSRRTSSTKVTTSFHGGWDRASDETTNRKTQEYPAREETKVTTFYRGGWHKPNDETTNRKSADLPQVHSSGFKTGQTQRLLTSSYDSLCNPDKSIAWGMLAHEENSSEDSSKEVSGYKKSTQSISTQTEGVDRSISHESRGSKETAADLIRRTGSNYQEKDSFGHAGTSGSMGDNSVPYSSRVVYENERKSETRSGETKSKPWEKPREESSSINRSYKWAQDSRIDEVDHTTIVVDEDIQRQRDTHYQFVPSREFRSRTRYPQYPPEPRDFPGPHRVYPQHDVRHYSPDTSHQDQSPRTRNDRSPFKRENRHDDDRIVTEKAQEVKEEEPLQILDVHQYFRDDFDLNTVDAFESNLEKIDIIEQYAKPFESKVKNFDGDLLEFFVLDEKLMQAIEKLDKIKCQDDHRANGRKREVIEYIKSLHEILDERGKNL